MFRRLMTVTSGCLKASSMDARFLSVSFFLWPTGKRNVVSSIPRMLERNIWLGFFKTMIWANEMLNIVLSVLTINNAKAGGIVSRTFKSECRSRFWLLRPLIYWNSVCCVDYDYDVDYDWKTPFDVWALKGRKRPLPCEIAKVSSFVSFSRALGIVTLLWLVWNLGLPITSITIFMPNNCLYSRNLVKLHKHGTDRNED